MDRNHSLKIAAVISAAILAAIALRLIVLPVDEIPAPDVWVAGRDYMHVIEFNASGTYRSYVRCDVCENGKSGAETGRWIESNNKITLFQDAQNGRSVLIRSAYENCAGLLPEKRPSAGKEPSLSDFYFREEDPCPRAL